ncbi:MAG: OsmC family protein [Eubacteriales bacterium]|nr:OsmC family protein [Eubacteriales bacterium]
MKAEVKRLGSYRCELTVNGHQMILDQAPERGGDGEGANPLAHLAGALGVCKLMVAHAYCQRRGIELESAEATVEVLEVGPESKPEEVFDCQVYIRAQMSDDERVRFERALKTCHIGRIIEEPHEVRQTLHFD